MQSPAFSSFRPLLDCWDVQLALEQKKKEIGDQLDKHGCIMFFKRDNDFFGAPEESRLMFAKMKGKDTDVTDQWRKEAHFIAVNLIQSMLGQSTENLFGIADLPKIQLIDRENVIEELAKKKKKK